MPINYSYSASGSETDLKLGPGCDAVVIDNGNTHQGRYQSLGKTTSLVDLGQNGKNGGSAASLESAILPTISGKVSESETSSSLSALNKPQPGDEGMVATLIQVVGPFLVAGIGSMCTGLLLDVVQKWENFTMIDSLITLVPTLLGLKGNLEMTVTARLCTASNMGTLDKPEVLLRFLRDDLLLTQFQATIVSMLASLLTLCIQALKDPTRLSWSHSIVLISSSVVTAAVACLFLGLLMTGVIALSRKLGINPDNVAAPLASSLGDISTLALFSYISLGLFTVREYIAVPIALTCFLVILCPMWGRLAWQSPEARGHLQHGWLPILLAMSISLGAGYILDIATSSLSAASAYVPVVSGVCGNLLVILICRMTTYLRQRALLGEGHVLVSGMRADHPFRCDRRQERSNLNSTFQLLLALPILAHLIFLPIISFFTQEVAITAVYLLVFLSFVFLHAVLMLFLTRETVFRLWTWGVDPDVASIPILTAVADLTGGAFTCAIFVTLYYLQDWSVMASSSQGELADLTTTPLADGVNVTQLLL